MKIELKIKELKEMIFEEKVKIEKMKKILSMVDTKVANLGDDEITRKLGYCQMWGDDVDWRLREYRRCKIDREVGVIVDFDCGLSAVVEVFLSRINSDDEINWGDSELYDSGNIEEEIWDRGYIINQIECLINEIENEIPYSENKIDENKIEEIKDLKNELNYIIEDFPFEKFYRK